MATGGLKSADEQALAAVQRDAVTRVCMPLGRGEAITPDVDLCLRQPCRSFRVMPEIAASAPAAAVSMLRAVAVCGMHASIDEQSTTNTTRIAAI